MTWIIFTSTLENTQMTKDRSKELFAVRMVDDTTTFLEQPAANQTHITSLIPPLSEELAA